MRILLVYDLPDWILENIAKNLQKNLSKPWSITILASHSPEFKWNLLRLQCVNDVVHFLSPWDFFENSTLIFRPCAVMIWHMADWKEFHNHKDRIDALTTGSAEWVERIRKEAFWFKSLFRMPYGLDTDKFRKNYNSRARFIQKYSLPSDSIIVGFAASSWSNESGRKGIDRVWSCVLEANQLLDVPVYLRMIGRHWDVNQIPLQVRNHVVIELNIPTEDLPDYYSSLNYYLCASHMEGVPYPVIESMACGAIPITTKVGITPEIILNGVNGFLLSQTFTPLQFAELVRDLHSYPEITEQVKDNTRSHVVTKLEWRNLDFSELIKAYQSTVLNYRQRSSMVKLMYTLTSAWLFSIYLGKRFNLSTFLRRLKTKI